MRILALLAAAFALPVTAVPVAESEHPSNGEHSIVRPAAFSRVLNL